MPIAGVDEAGRGPLAGPVVAAAVVLDPAHPIAGLKDSKLLKAAEREDLAAQIRHVAVAFALGRAEVEEIDALNILRASLLAMRRAVLALPMAPAGVWVDGPMRPILPGATLFLSPSWVGIVGWSRPSAPLPSWPRWPATRR